MTNKTRGDSMAKQRDVHPVADLFPMLADDELAELAADIKARGQLQPIVLDAEGRIIDGRNRLAACELAGVKPQFTTYEGDDPAGYALAVNIARRHLSTGARAMIAAKAARNNRVYLTADKIAEAANLQSSSTRVNNANIVLDWAPSLAEAVITGAKPLSKAVEEARAEKKKAEALKAKMDRLRDEAPDLLALVDEGRMDVDDATAALDAREEKARQEAAAKAAEEAAREHEERVRRVQDIEAARRFAKSIVAEFRSAVVTVVTGCRYGERGLVTKEMVVDLRKAVDLLEGEL